ncbi:MAG: hypothetical protein ACXQT2_06620 [Methanotrichaceae archaeon]
MNGSYVFLVDLERLTTAYRRLVRVLNLLDAAIIAILVYGVALFMGIPAFFELYWQDVPLLARAPVIFSILLGCCGAKLLSRRSRSDIYRLFDPVLLEKTKTAYDNRRSDSVVMERLAEDVRRRLALVRSADLIKRSRFTLGGLSMPLLHLKTISAVFLFGALIIISHSQIGEDISPPNLQPLEDLRDKATSLFQEKDFSDQGDEGSDIPGDIYGKPSLAVLDEVNLELLLYPGTGAGSLSRETETMSRFFQTAPLGEGVAVPTELYIESLPPQHREIVKRYFENLAEIDK